MWQPKQLHGPVCYHPLQPLLGPPLLMTPPRPPPRPPPRRTRTAEIHMQYKLRMTRDQVLDSAVTAVKHLRSLGCNDIEFSPEDAGALRCSVCVCE